MGASSGSVARPSVRKRGRADSCLVKPAEESVTRRLDEQWREGCRWAGIAVALTFGPMLAWGIFWGYL